ncbi:MAG: HAD family hydrolase [Solirubrobacteraceae bacterium]
MIRAVISDFGGVLTTPLAGSLKAFADRSGLAMEELNQALAAIFARDGAHPLFELECGRMTEARFLQALEQTLRAELGREVSFVDFAEALWAGLAPNEPMIELMAALRAEGYRMALLTNNVREWEARWRAMAPIDDIFELVVNSASVGMRKPDSEIYELTVQRLGVPAPSCLFVDDLEHNCAAARDAGMQAVLYRDPEQATAEIRAALDASA